MDQVYSQAWLGNIRHGSTQTPRRHVNDTIEPRSTSAHQRLLEPLAAAVAAGQYQALATDTKQIKPVPADGASWNEQYKSA